MDRRSCARLDQRLAIQPAKSERPDDDPLSRAVALHPQLFSEARAVMNSEFDAAVRARVYDMTMRTGGVPLSADVAKALSASSDAVLAAFDHLASAHVLVLQPETGEILMANPF